MFEMVLNTPLYQALKNVMKDFLKPFSSNPFHATDLFLYPMDTLENLWFADVLRG